MKKQISLGGNQLPKGSKRKYSSDELLSLKKWSNDSSKTIWDISQTTSLRSSLGTAWAIRKTK